jgi:hypothetical protein
MKTVIHVNRQFISQNAKDGKHRPVYTIKQGRKTIYAHGVKIRGGEVELIDPRVTPPLKCGARAWLSVSGGDIEFVEPSTFKEVLQK